jgi:hypothetical protein
MTVLLQNRDLGDKQGQANHADTSRTRLIVSESKSIKCTRISFEDLNGYEILIVELVDYQDFCGKLARKAV